MPRITRAALIQCSNPVEGEADLDGELDGAAVEDGEGAGEAEDDGVDAGVGAGVLVGGVGGAGGAAEGLGGAGELDVHLEADDEFDRGDLGHGRWYDAGRVVPVRLTP